MTDIEKRKMKILHCPFCGSKSKIKQTLGIGDYDYNEKYYDITCTNDDCYLQDGAEWRFDTPEEAIQMWNDRDIKLLRKEKLKQLENKNDMLECIQNLMGAFDTPIARRKINDNFSNEVRIKARKIIEKYEK